ncbi:hypothetical protein E2562_010050 [Oryza meyeriana var. granulata]|uniref:Uncharacterized protein n=1 Tax=Oryza meyeriana var. granulata TaxID=110450 RepID=A0A6G1EIY2_9ORYZ|nr:hypothetical protein E2562_010050 [Oryza meyeriana var. granulata]
MIWQPNRVDAFRMNAWEMMDHRCIPRAATGSRPAKPPHRPFRPFASAFAAMVLLLHASALLPAMHPAAAHCSQQTANPNKQQHMMP